MTPKKQNKNSATPRKKQRVAQDAKKKTLCGGSAEGLVDEKKRYSVLLLRPIIKGFCNLLPVKKFLLACFFISHVGSSVLVVSDSIWFFVE